ncbi:hypothetical protein lbkm_0332 [Lachnospiraceae bacterium KM106-2]|nr:hypothetical protein lbkm_0332 [Lachnospiraceae bacterium KM106-2]
MMHILIILLVTSVSFLIFLFLNARMGVFLFLLWIGYMVISLLSLYQIKRQLDSGFEGTNKAHRKEPLHFTLLLCNHSRISAAACKVEIDCKNEINLTTTTIEKCSYLLPKEILQLSLQLTPEWCGVYTLSIRKLILSDFLGFFHITLHPCKHYQFTIYPDLIDIRIQNLDGSRFESDSSYYPDHSQLDPYEVNGIREYQDGDSLKQIHWKLSNKLDRYMVKEYSLPSYQMIQLFIDTTYSTQDHPSLDQIEHFMESAYSLSTLLLHLQDYLTISFYDGKRQQIQTYTIQTEDELSSLLDSLLQQPFLAKEELLESPFLNGFQERFLSLSLHKEQAIDPNIISISYDEMKHNSFELIL